jgi:hypothetical protein
MTTRLSTSCDCLPIIAAEPHRVAVQIRSVSFGELIETIGPIRVSSHDRTLYELISGLSNYF